MRERGVRAAVFVVLIVWAAASCYGYARWLQNWGGLAVDFHGELWQPDRQILGGINPYPRSVTADLGWQATYPPPIMLATLPLAKLPFVPAAWLWVGLLSLAAVASLFVLRVRDARCYAAALVSGPVFAGIAVGNVTPLVVLSAASAWRWRDRPARGAPGLALGLIVKPILWPVVLWALLTRRVRLAAGSVALALVVDIIGWASIDFHGLRNYPSLMSSLARSAASHGLLLTSTLVNAGAGFGVALVPSLILAALLLAWAARTRDDRWIFTASLTVALFLTPVMWIHYLSVLFVPLSIWRRRFDALWLAPLALWVVARVYHHPDNTRPLWTSLFTLATVAFVGWRLVSARSPSSAPAREP